MDTGDVELVRHEIRDALEGVEMRLNAISERTGLSAEEVRAIVQDEIAGFRSEMAETMTHVEQAANEQIEAAIDEAEREIEAAVDEAVTPVEESAEAAADAIEEVADAVQDAVEDVEHGAEHIEGDVAAPIDALDEAVEESAAPRRGSWWFKPVISRR